MGSIAVRLCLFAALCALTLLASFAAHADSRPNFMIMGLDADEQGTDTRTIAVGRYTRVFTRVLDAISEQLRGAGFDTYDERALDAAIAARTETALVGVARAFDKPPMDAVVFFTVYTGARRLAYTTEVYVRITGRVLNAGTGERPGAFEVTSPKGWRAPFNCERDCLVEAVGKSAKALATDVSGTLAQKVALAGSARSTQKVAAVAKPRLSPDAFRLSFAGFSAADVDAALEYLVAFKGYKSHRAIGSAEYAYEYRGGAAALTRDLRMMLDRIGTEGRVSYSSDDHFFKIARKAIDNEPKSATLAP